MCIRIYFRCKGSFQVKLEKTRSLLSPLVQENDARNNWYGLFLQSQCYNCHPTNRVKPPKEIQYDDGDDDDDDDDYYYYYYYYYMRSGMLICSLRLYALTFYCNQLQQSAA